MEKPRWIQKLPKRDSHSFGVLWQTVALLRKASPRDLTVFLNLINAIEFLTFDFDLTKLIRLYFTFFSPTSVLSLPITHSNFPHLFQKHFFLFIKHQSYTRSGCHVIDNNSYSTWCFWVFRFLYSSIYYLTLFINVFINNIFQQSCKFSNSFATYQNLTQLE